MRKAQLDAMNTPQSLGQLSNSGSITYGSTTYPNAIGGLGHAIGYSGWTAMAPYTAPAPKSYPESAAAVAGFAAGIKHALNKIMGGDGHDPEKQRLYEEMMAAAVKAVLAPEQSEEVKRRALLKYANGWMRVIEVGDPLPETMTIDQVDYRLTVKPGPDAPIAVYEG
jgi:hypothetical protein